MNEEKLDEGTDIYSFGVMIYEMVVGRLPYEADTPMSIIEDHVFTPPPPPTSIKPGLSREVEQVILKTLAKKRSDRYDRVSTLVRAFNNAWVHDHDSVSTTTMEASRIATLLAENGKAFHLASDVIVLGRNSLTKNVFNDIDLSDLDVKKIISRRHASIRREQDEFVLYDLDSRNGTFLNGKRLPASQPHTLVPGDVIEFGSGGVKLTFSR
jgi:serine/threonine protein kinase